MSEAREKAGSCPFCGHVMHVGFEDIDGWIAYLSCYGCDMRGPSSEFKYDDEAEAEADATERWRAALAGSDHASLAAAQSEVARLRAAIAEHHAQKADDRCIEDDDRLYAAAGLPPCDRRVGDKAAMLASCARFIERRCEAGGWPAYAELEAEVARLREELARARGLLRSFEWAAVNESGRRCCPACGAEAYAGASTTQGAPHGAACALAVFLAPPAPAPAPVSFGWMEIGPAKAEGEGVAGA